MREPIVFLPGMMCDARLFAPQMGAFSAEHPILFIPPVGTDSMADLARQVLEAAPPCFAIAGLSMGGIIAMEVIRQAPERISRVALMDTNPLADPPEKAPIREAQVLKVRRGGLVEVMREEMKPTYLADGPDKPAILDLCMEMAEALGAEVFASQSNAIQRRRDQSETLRNLSVPALLLCGEADQLCPISRHELMHDLIPNSRLEMIQGAGHLPTLEQPDRTNEALRNWLKM